jgi:hypothetical protein
MTTGPRKYTLDPGVGRLEFTRLRLRCLEARAPEQLDWEYESHCQALRDEIHAWDHLGITTPGIAPAKPSPLERVTS